MIRRCLPLFQTTLPKNRLNAYLRLIRHDKQIGTWLLAIPCWWGHALGFAATGTPAVDVAALCAGGALCMRSAGCIVNDMWDRDFDKQVERTKLRPIAAGEVSLPLAFSYLTAHMTVGLGVLLCLHPYSVFIGTLSVPLIALYPLCKRVTHLPQLFLGFTFNWGVLVGYSSIVGSMCWSTVLPMYAAGIFWTLLYDTVYAHQDKVDDIKIGVKSSALLLGDTKTPLHAFTACVTSLSCFSAYSAGLVVATPGLLVAGGCLHYSLHRVKLGTPASCSRFFSDNKYFGIVVAVALTFAAILLQNSSEKEKDKNSDSYFPNIYFSSNINKIRQVASGEREIGWSLLKI